MKKKPKVEMAAMRGGVLEKKGGKMRDMDDKKSDKMKMMAKKK